MSAFFSLLKLQLKQQFRPRRGQKLGSAAWLLLPLAFLPLFAVLVAFYGSVAQVGALLGAPGIAIELAILVSMLAGVMFGLNYIIASFYYATDLPLLIPLPLAPQSVLYAKFAVLLLNELVSIAILYLPAVVGYGLRLHPGASFWPLALVVFLLLPFIPLAVAALLALGLMALTNGRVNRDGLRVAGSVLFVLLWLGLQSLQRYWVNRNFASGLSPEGIAAVQRLAQRGGLLDLIGRYFPPSVWATRAILGEWTSLLLFVSATVLIGCVLAAGARAFFYRGLVGGDEGPRRRRAFSEKRLSAAIGRAGSPTLAVFWREVRQFNRTPVFLMQGLTPALMAPIYVLMPLMSEGGVTALRAMAGRAARPGLLFAAVGMTQFLLAMAPVASTAFSREGAHFWLSRALPLSGRDQIRGKLLHAMLVSAAYVFLFTVALAIVLRPPLHQLLVFMVANLLGALICSAIGLRMDLASPRLSWSEPQQAFKGNYNVIYTMLLYAPILLAIGGFAALMLRFGEIVAYSCGLALLAGAGALAYREALAYGDSHYDRIEA